MVHRPPYPWYVYPLTNGISNPLPMVFLPPAYLLIRNDGGGGVKIVLCVCFVDHCLSFCPFLPLCCLSFDLRIRITPFGFGILKPFLKKAVIHFPIGSYVRNCHCRGAKTLCCSLFILFWGNLIQNFP